MLNARIDRLRSVMKREGFSAYLIPLGDPHQSEYPADHWKALGWITGFTGSAGFAMLALEHAGLWTDSRYFIQAEDELSDNYFELHKMNMGREPSYLDWLGANLAEGSTVIVDGPMISLSQESMFRQKLEEKGLKLKITEDFISKVWDQDRPTLPKASIFEHPLEYAGQSRAEKIQAVRKEMERIGAEGHLITTLDDIAWLLNCRGRDVDCNPVFVSFVYIKMKEVHFFIDSTKVENALAQALIADGVVFHEYHAIGSFLENLGASHQALIHKATINYELYQAIKGSTVIEGKLISRHLKALKNPVELKHIDRVMVKDGVALAKAFYWLENTLNERTITEYEFAHKIADCRSAQEHYFGESFNAIVGYKGNGAIIHYRPDQNTSANIKSEGMLLVDSGGQYLDGTTDITRTFCFSSPTEEEKASYTRVLKGHINLAKAKFPEGTNGGQLDTLARFSLWEAGLNYGHGTGHGVGFFLNVHEPPQGFAPGSAGRASSVQKAGMLTSNEPGHYVQDKYGIRIENLVVTKKAEQEGYLEFETVTYYPIATNLIDFSLLTKAEVDWLNAYHKTVKEKLCPQLEEPYKSWIQEQCKPV